MTFTPKPVVLQIVQSAGVEAVVWNGQSEPMTSQQTDPNVFRDPAIVATWPVWLASVTKVFGWDQKVDPTTIPQGEAWQSEDTLWIGTPEGPMKAEPGDWIVKGADGSPYPVTAATFEHLFDPARQGSEVQGRQTDGDACFVPGSVSWWTVRRVANGDARKPWYELTDEDRAALNPA